MKVTDKQKDIVDSLIDKSLTDDVLPWHNPYLLAGIRPYNASTGECYRGVNRFSLGYADSDSKAFVTFKQANDAGLKINKGAKGYAIAFFSMFNKEDENKAVVESFPILKTYVVFKIEDTSGSRDKLKLHDVDTRQADKSNADVDKALGVYVATLSGGLSHARQDRACYTPSLDLVNIPSAENMAQGTYYATLCHELIHSTGHETRLKRLLKSFSCDRANYSQEELIAEIGAVLLQLELGLKPDVDNSAAYLKSWSKYIKANPIVMYSAASKADKAVEFIKGVIHG